MSISKKIREEILNLSGVNADFKKLMLDILIEEDKGNYKFTEFYEKLINDYISLKKKLGDISDWDFKDRI